MAARKIDFESAVPPSHYEEGDPGKKKKKKRLGNRRFE